MYFNVKQKFARLRVKYKNKLIKNSDKNDNESIQIKEQQSNEKEILKGHLNYAEKEIGNDKLINFKLCLDNWDGEKRILVYIISGKV